MPRLLTVEPREVYRLYLEISDGTRREVDLGEHLWGPVFEPLDARIQKIGALRVGDGRAAFPAVAKV